MITIENGRTLQNTVVVSLVIRSDSSPIPITMEADIRALDGVEKWMEEGRTVSVGKYEFEIVKSRLASGLVQQGDKDTGGYSITCLMKGTKSIALPMARNVFKEKPTIQDCYRLSGSQANVFGSVMGQRFALLRGDLPTPMINRVLQEAGAIVRWKKGKIQALTYPEIVAQKPIRYLPDIQGADDEMTFVARNEMPQYVSMDESRNVVQVTRSVPSPVYFVPHHDARSVRLMQQTIIQRRVAKIMLDMNIDAGDIVDVNGEKLIVVTAAHVPIDGYTKLWLGSIE
nr:MAG TPA: hypothetical protein [Caudoviricetes sp.]